MMMMMMMLMWMLMRGQVCLRVLGGVDVQTVADDPASSGCQERSSITEAGIYRIYTTDFVYRK